MYCPERSIFSFDNKNLVGKRRKYVAFPKGLAQKCVGIKAFQRREKTFSTRDKNARLVASVDESMR